MHAWILHPAIQESRFDQIESQAATSSEPPPLQNPPKHNGVKIFTFISNSDYSYIQFQNNCNFWKPLPIIVLRVLTFLEFFFFQKIELEYLEKMSGLFLFGNLQVPLGNVLQIFLLFKDQSIKFLFRFIVDILWVKFEFSFMLDMFDKQNGQCTLNFSFLQRLNFRQFLMNSLSIKIFSNVISEMIWSNCEV